MSPETSVACTAGFIHLQFNQNSHTADRQNGLDLQVRKMILASGQHDELLHYV